MGFRVIKTAIATILAIYTAQLLGVDNPLSAGILAILGIDTTRWRGIKTVFARFMASLFGLFIASILFYYLGFHIWVLAVFILLAYPLLTRTGLKDGIITGSVIVFHIYSNGEITLDGIVTELQLLTIGLGSATLLNLIYMPKESNTLIALREQTEQGFSIIFQHLALYLRDLETEWSGEEMLRTEAAIEEGIKVAQRARENRLIPQNEPWQLYFHMRRQQMESIELMMESVAFVSSHVPQAEHLAVLFDRLSKDVKSEYYEGETERMLMLLEQSYKEMSLPVSRNEFEIRSSLLQLTRELHRFLAIASREKKRKETSVPSLIQ